MYILSAEQAFMTSALSLAPLIKSTLSGMSATTSGMKITFHGFAMRLAVIAYEKYGRNSTVYGRISPLTVVIWRIMVKFHRALQNVGCKGSNSIDDRLYRYLLYLFYRIDYRQWWNSTVVDRF